VLFHTLGFALFLPVVWTLYWLTFRHPRLRSTVLLLASWTFYAAWDVRFLSLLVGSTALDYACGIGLGRTDDPIRRRRIAAVSVVGNLGLLGAFKYYDFFVTSFAALLAEFGLHVEPWTLNIVLPVGISFYTFQTLGTTLDVYRRRAEPERDPVLYAAYVAFFPQLVAGPIERAAHLLPQLRSPRAFAWRDQLDGVLIFTVGLVQKVVVADRLAPVVEQTFAARSGELVAADVVIGAWAFAFQIFGDFSGYSDMAIGIALLFGIQLSDNFRGPYLSSNPREFWQRWHVSLSTWLRDQLYIPLGGSRGSAFATTRNLLVTMLLGGLWHGAAWTFVAWGAAHGVWLALHRALDRVLPRPGSRVTAALARVAGIVVTFHCVCATWILFRADDLSAAWIQFESLVVPGFGPDQWAKLRYVVQFAWLGVFIQGLQYHRPQVLRGGVARISLIVLGVYALSRILTDGAFSDARAFIYFQF
jgi:alginate O-acetyltransferase complex protein AlgI